MKKLFHPLSITFFVVSLLLSLPLILPKKELTTYTDTELRSIALSRNMLPTPPITYEELLNVTDTTKNPLTPSKIALGKKLYFEKNLS